jgi:hypothetical protein
MSHPGRTGRKPYRPTDKPTDVRKLLTDNPWCVPTGWHIAACDCAMGAGSTTYCTSNEAARPTSILPCYDYSVASTVAVMGFAAYGVETRMGQHTQPAHARPETHTRGVRPCVVHP